jgi:hypothetical protein
MGITTLSARWSDKDQRLSDVSLNIDGLTPMMLMLEKPKFAIHIDEDDKACLPTGIPVAAAKPAAKPAATPAAKPVANPTPGEPEELHTED